MDSPSDEETLALICMYMCQKRKQKKGKQKSVWVRGWIRRRGQSGAYHALLKEIEEEDPRSLKNFLRIDKDNFKKILEMVTPLIQKASTPMRDSISAGEKLALTLRYLATGDSYQSLEFLYRIPKNTICQFIPEVCSAIYEVLQKDYLQVPDSEDKWRKIQEDFMKRWQFPHCTGAIDGKHIAIRAPGHSGSVFYNYKKFFSLILLALVDANCRFIFVDVGANGRAVDAAVFANSELANALEQNTLNIPPPEPLEGRQELVPSVVVGDDAVPLKSFLMKPYPLRNLSSDKRIFNYRLSRARRVSENAFGILVSRFCVFRKPLQVSPEVGVKIIMAAVSVLNFLKSKDDQMYHNHNDTLVESNILGFIQQGGNRHATNAMEVRDEISDYFITNGQVQWQWDMVV